MSTNKYYLYISKKANRSKFKKSNPIKFLDELKEFNLIYLSSAYVSQERGSAYCFMNLGKYLERTIFSIDILNFKILELSENNQSLVESLFLKNLIFLIIGENELVYNAKKLQNTLTYTTINSIKEIGLNSFLFELKNDLNNLSQLINQRYFSQL